MEVLTKEEVLELVEQATRPLYQEIATLKALTDEWIDTEAAMRLSGVSKDTLIRERRQPGTLIQHRKQGRKNLYSRTSLLAFAAARSNKRDTHPLLSRPARQAA